MGSTERPAIRALSARMNEAAKRRGNPAGATAANVAANVKELRGSEPLRGLSARLEAIGHPLAASALQRVESGERRVDVDDLTALARVLNVSPAALLKPPSEQDAGQLTGVEEQQTKALTLWLQGLEPLPEQRRGLLNALDGAEDGALALWLYSYVQDRVPLRDANDELKARLVFISRHEMALGVGPLWVSMTTPGEAVYAINKGGEVLFQVPDDAPGVTVHVVEADADGDGRARYLPAYSAPILDQMQAQIDELRGIVMRSVRDTGPGGENGDD